MLIDIFQTRCFFSRLWEIRMFKRQRSEINLKYLIPLPFIFLAEFYQTQL